MQSFRIGAGVKKNPFQKAKQLRQQKKKQDNREAAEVYEDFVASFSGSSSRSEPKAALEIPKQATESKFRSKALPREKRTIHQLMEDDARENGRRRPRQAFDRSSTSGRGDHSNDAGFKSLYVGNLPRSATRESVLNLFREFGQVESVKILRPPQTTRDSSRDSQNGFVDFFRRKDAQRAQERLSGVLFEGHTLIVKPSSGAYESRNRSGSVEEPTAGPRATKATSSKFTSSHKSPDLASEEYDDWCELLQHLDLSREKIAHGMAFALEHADFAQDVVSVLQESLNLHETAPALKIARLYLLSDILFNSTQGVRNASQYRPAIEKILYSVFEAVNRCIRSSGRFTGEATRHRALSVLAAWASVCLFPPSYLIGLEAMLMHGSPEEEMVNEAVGSVAADAIDLEELKRRCRGVGLPPDPGRDPIPDLRRVTAIELYSERKLGAEPPIPVGVPPPPLKVRREDGQGEEGDTALAAPETEEAEEAGGWVSMDPSNEKEEEEDIDGEPLEDDDPLLMLVNND